MESCGTAPGRTTQSELRHIDPQTGKVLESVEMPAGVFVSGLESDGKDRFLLRWRKEREGESGATAEARLNVAIALRYWLVPTAIPLMR